MYGCGLYSPAAPPDKVIAMFRRFIAKLVSTTSKTSLRVQAASPTWPTHAHLKKALDDSNAWGL